MHISLLVANPSSLGKKCIYFSLTFTCRSTILFKFTDYASCVFIMETENSRALSNIVIT